MSKWIAWLLSYLQIGIVDDTDPADESEESEVEEEEQEEEEQEEEAEETPAVEAKDKGQSRAQRAIVEARRRAQEAEERSRRLEAERDEARRSQAPARPPEDAQFAAEEARLRAADVTELEKWQIQSNRTIRRSEQQALAAQIQASDTADRTAYQARSMDNQRMRAYATRVEDRLTEMRKSGQNAPREAIYRYLLGEDVDKGTVKTAAAKPKAKAGALSENQRAARPECVLM